MLDDAGHGVAYRNMFCVSPPPRSALRRRILPFALQLPLLRQSVDSLRLEPPVGFVVTTHRSPQGRKRTIMARYVFGDEFKPSERWKRRLLTVR
jgi:hypothetical protein